MSSGEIYTGPKIQPESSHSRPITTTVGESYGPLEQALNYGWITKNEIQAVSTNAPSHIRVISFSVPEAQTIGGLGMGQTKHPPQCDWVGSLTYIHDEKGTVQGTCPNASCRQIFKWVNGLNQWDSVQPNIIIKEPLVARP